VTYEIGTNPIKPCCFGTSSQEQIPEWFHISSWYDFKTSCWICWCN